MFGFIIALENEYKINVKDYKKEIISGFLTYQNKKEVYIYSGVGKANAAAAVTILINFFKVKKIINIGTVGSIDKSLKTFDVIVPNQITYFDVDITAFGYAKNQMAREKEFYKPTLTLRIPSKKAVLRTGETFVTLKNYKSLKVNDGVVDMEGCAIAMVCSKAKIPFGFVKIVSDSIFETKKSDGQWKQNISQISDQFSSLIETIKK